MRENRLKQDSRYILRVTDLEHELMHTPAQPKLNKNNAIYSCLRASFGAQNSLSQSLPAAAQLFYFFFINVRVWIILASQYVILFSFRNI